MTDTPQAVISLEYASSKGEYALHPSMLTLARFSLWTSILSGLAVGSCVLILTRHPAAIILHIVVYTVLIWSAVRCGIAAVTMTVPSRWQLYDLMALVGLAIIGVAPVAMLADKKDTDTLGAVAIGVAFLLLTITAWRAAMFYRGIAAGLRPSSAKLAKMLVALGWTKAVYETAWLACCTSVFIVGALRQNSDSVILFAYGALLGLFGFIGVWVWMIVAHSILLNRVKWLLQ